MVRLKYLNDRNNIVDPLLHSQIVTGYSLTDYFLIVNCKRTILSGDKPTDFKWNVTPPVKDIQNLPEVLAWLTENKYEHVVIDKPTKSDQKKSKKNRSASSTSGLEGSKPDIQIDLNLE